MEQQPTTEAADESRRRAEVLAMLAARRRRRRIITGVVAGAAAIAVATGSVVAWTSQDAAAATAAQIGEWHDARDRAICEAEVRAVAAVALTERAEGVLEAAERVRDAEQLLGASERAAFDDARLAVLQSIDDGDFVTQDDRSAAARWASLAAASGDADGFDVRAACLAEAEAEREPVEGVTAARAAALREELHELGEAEAVGTERFDRLEASLGAFIPSILALAESRTPLDVLRERFALAPAATLDELDAEDREVAAILAAARASGAAIDALDLVERLALQVAATWMAESFQLEAVGRTDEAAARAAAAQQVQQEVAQVRPRPPATVLPQPAPPAQPSAPAPAPSTPGRPTPSVVPDPPSVEPTLPPEQTPAPPVQPEPTSPPEPTSDPEPQPEPEPEPEPAPSDPGDSQTAAPAPDGTDVVDDLLDS